MKKVTKKGDISLGFLKLSIIYRIVKEKKGKFGISPHFFKIIHRKTNFPFLLYIDSFGTEILIHLKSQEAWMQTKRINLWKYWAIIAKHTQKLLEWTSNLKRQIWFELNCKMQRIKNSNEWVADHDKCIKMCVWVFLEAFKSQMANFPFLLLK